MMAVRRIAVVNSHPVQYSAPLYAYLNQDPELEITALYCTDYSLRGGRDAGFGRPVAWDIDLLQGYRSVFLGPRARIRSIDGFWSLVVPEVWREIRSGRYDAVWIHGYGYAAYVLAFLAAKSAGLKVFMRSETHARLARPGWKRKLRDSVLAKAYRHVDRFLAIGSANHDYYRSLGIAEDRIDLVPYTVDNARFIAEAGRKSALRGEIRERFGLPAGLPVILFASKFMPRKHPECVLHAAALLRERGVETAVLMVGTGELEAELRQLADRLDLAHVNFTGFVNQAQLPEVYVAADVFVLPSSNEPWGFIINEVMCAGLPIVVSDDIGSVPDLVEEGGNGRLMQAGDPESLARGLEDILSNPVRMEAMGRRSLAIISGWDYERCRQGLQKATRAAFGAGR